MKYVLLLLISSNCFAIESDEEIAKWRYEMLNRPSATADTPIATEKEMQLIYKELDKIRKADENAYPWAWYHGENPSY